MTDDPTSTASIGYAWARMQRALETVRQHADPSVRARARAKLDRWQAVIEGMASGDLSVGRRAPVAETPAWVTLEVMHGGFATGNYLAEGPLLPHESERLATLDPQPSESTPRAQLNRWFLGDEGQGVLSEAIAARRIDVKLPEEGALAVVAWLTEHGYPAEALELTATLQPLMHRLRFYPPLTDKPRPRGSTVTLQTAAEAAVEVRRVQPQPSVETMNEALRVWNPLCDRLVALWSSTVDGALPHLERDDSGQLARGRNGQPIVAGSWPCRRWPDDWAALREAWLADYTRATKAHRRCRKHAHPRSNFARLRNALKRCPTNSQALDGRAVGWIRRALANTSSRRGAPGSKRRTALRQEQARAAARPSFVAFAQVVATRLDTAEPGRGLAGLDIVDRPIQPNEHPALPPGIAIPRHLVAKAERALEAPIEELVQRGVIGSAEVLAEMLPQVTARIASAGLDDAALRELYEQIYAAFRRRRSLLLLDLAHQVQLEELPWVAALHPLRRADLGTATQATEALAQVTVLALSAFPQTITPNPLVSEMRPLAKRADLSLPLVEEIAADIFMGTFTAKWAQAAAVASRRLAGTVYARYYDLPRPEDALALHGDTGKRWGKRTARGFAELCTRRAKEAGDGNHGVARNGAILEQSQILTTHNLAVLLDGLGLEDTLRQLAPDLAERTLQWVVRRHQQTAPAFTARLRMLKNTAYAWRQALFYLSLCEPAVQHHQLAQLEALVWRQDPAWAQRFSLVVAGLRMVMEGGRFNDQGRGTYQRRPVRRLLGWSVGHHWLMPPRDGD